MGGRETTSRARTTVRVTIRDRNDNGPTFNAKAYNIEVPEGLNRGNQLPGLDMIVKDADLVSYDYQCSNYFFSKQLTNLLFVMMIFIHMGPDDE